VSDVIPQARTGTLLELDDVSVVYGRRGQEPLRAVEGVSLQMRPGEVVGLVGESGSGKSSLARAICGLEPLAGGSVRFDGHPVEPLGLRARPAHLRRIQLVFQNPAASLNPRRTVRAHVEDGRGAHPQGASASRTVEELLIDVGLDASFAGRYPHELSGGQRQRVAIARAVAPGPRLLIGDEPIAALDASLQLRVATLLRDVAIRSGAGLLFITHDLAIVRMIADRIVVMSQGRVVEEGPTAQVWTAPSHAYTRRLLASVPVADGLGRLPGLADSVD
jgi:ABC-type glutathione transport system ATPase component